MVDVALASVILLVAAGGLCSVVITLVRLARTTEESGDAYEAARAMTEQIHATDVSLVFANLTANPNFAVPGLNVAPGDADGFAGEIRFPSVGGQLREDFVDASLGMPRDLNGDAIVDALDHSGDYILLPLTVRVRWLSASGTRTVDISMLLVSSP